MPAARSDFLKLFTGAYIAEKRAKELEEYGDTAQATQLYELALYGYGRIVEIGKPGNDGIARKLPAPPEDIADYHGWGLLPDVFSRTTTLRDIVHFALEKIDPDLHTIIEGAPPIEELYQKHIAEQGAAKLAHAYN